MSNKFRVPNDPYESMTEHRPRPARFVEVAAGISTWTEDEQAYINTHPESQKYLAELIAALGISPLPAAENEWEETVGNSADEDQLVGSANKMPREIRVTIGAVSVRVIVPSSMARPAVIYCDDVEHQKLLQARCPNLSMSFDEFGYSELALPVKDVVMELEAASHTVIPQRVSESSMGEVMRCNIEQLRRDAKILTTDPQRLADTSLSLRGIVSRLSRLRREAVMEWLRGSRWFQPALKMQDPIAVTLSSHVLNRFLCDLDTRTSPERLRDWWEEIVTGCGAPASLAHLWGVDQFKPSANSKDHVAEQEAAFASLLIAVADSIESSAHLEWAARVLREIARVRRADEYEAGFHVPIVWNVPLGTLPGNVCDAVVVRFNLGAPDAWAPVMPEGIFAGDFTETIKLVQRSVGATAFRQVRLSGECDRGLFIQGRSAGAAVLATQLLAAKFISPFGPGAYALRDDVAILATYDGGGFGRVDSLVEKIQALSRVGVRSILVADESEQISQATAVAHRLQRIVALPKNPSELLDSLANSTLVRRVDLSRFSKHINVPTTAALQAHRREAMRELAHDVLRYARDWPEKPENYLFSKLNAAVIDDRPTSAQLSGFEVLLDSIAFDNVDWTPVPDVSQIKTLPVEPAYCTRVIRLKRTDEARLRIAFEFNTSGFATIPLLDGDAPPPRVLVELRTPMLEVPDERLMCKSIYLEYEVSEFAPVGVPFEIVISVVYFNGTQDQVRPRSEGGRPADHDWWGKRVAPGCREADLAVILPSDRACESRRFVRRLENGNRKVIEPADGRDRVFHAASLRNGSVVDDTQAIWRLPQVTDETTIFSIEWSWKH